MSPRDHLNDEPIPSDIAGVAAALDVLAAAERAAAPAALEARIAAASSPTQPPVIVARIGPSRWRAAAAGLGIAACTGIGALLATRAPQALVAPAAGVSEAALLESAEAAITVAFADWSSTTTASADLAAVGKDLDGLDPRILADDSILTEGTN